MKTYQKWADIKNKGKSPERIAAIEAQVRADLLEMDLADLRREAGLTQVEAADAADMTQSHLSRFERGEGDRLISSLRRYVEALGGQLEVVAVLGNKRIALRGV
jgi:DNA-binding XRE family transcriptional regulator